VSKPTNPIPPSRREEGSGTAVALNWMLSRRLLPEVEVQPSNVYFKYAEEALFKPVSVEKSAEATAKLVTRVAVFTPVSVV
jgi:hypothetical protein